MKFYAFIRNSKSNKIGEFYSMSFDDIEFKIEDFCKKSPKISYNHLIIIEDHKVVNDNLLMCY